MRRGFKVWIRAEAVNGYVSGFEVYMGKKSDSVEKGLGATVVKTLVMICTTLTGICILTTSSPVSTFCLISSVSGFMGAAHSVQTVDDSQKF